MIRFIGASVAFALVGAPVNAQTQHVPAESGRSVRDYGAVGDGSTDDTDALQAALDDGRDEHADYFGRPRTLHLPAGTYLVRDTLRWRGCCVQLQGAGRDKTIIQLMDDSPGFRDTESPRAIIDVPRVEGNKSHRQYIFDLSLDVGERNPGAIGLDFISHNNGAVARVDIRAGEGSGVTGLALTEAWPGPLLIRDVRVSGFDVGIRIAHPEYAPTFESIALRHQRTAGMMIDGSIVPVHQLDSEQHADIPAVVSGGAGSLLVLLDASLASEGGQGSAMVVEGSAYLRAIATQGYARAVLTDRSTSGSAPVDLSDTTEIDELVVGEPSSLFDSPRRALHLPIQPSPQYEGENASDWAYAETKWPRDGRDAERLRAALRSGAPIVYLRGGATSVWGDEIEIPAHVRRIVGFGHCANGFGDDPIGLRFVVAEPSEHPVIIEQFGYGVTVHHAGDRAVALKYGGYRYQAEPNAGDLYLDDVVTHDLHFVAGQQVWARQLNTEGDVNVVNHGAQLWILGQKTERFGTVIHTLDGGLSELLGGLVYPSRSYDQSDSSLAAFLAEDSGHSLVFGTSVYVDRGFHPQLVTELRGSQQLSIPANPAPRAIPLHTGYTEQLVQRAREGSGPPAAKNANDRPNGERAKDGGCGVVRTKGAPGRALAVFLAVACTLVRRRRR